MKQEHTYYITGGIGDGSFSIMAGNVVVCGSFPLIAGGLPPVRFSGQAVITGKCNTLPILRGGGFTYVSRGADYAVRDGKRKIRAGKVRPVVAVWRRGRQDATLKQKKRKHGRLCFFYLAAPDHGEWAAPPPLSRKRTGLRPEPDHMTFGSMLLCAIIFHVGRRRE
jgi:hypothetical protein